MTLITHQRSPDERLLDTIVEAADLALDETEYRIGLETIGAVAIDYDDDAQIPAGWLVSEIEKNIGLGLDEHRYAQAVAAAQAWLLRSVWQVPAAEVQPAADIQPAPELQAETHLVTTAPDAHLEMEFEDRYALRDA